MVLAMTVSCKTSSCGNHDNAIVSEPIAGQTADLAQESSNLTQKEYFNPATTSVGYFLTYVEPGGETATVDHLDDVPVEVKGLVRVDIPNMPPPRGAIWLADLSSPTSNTKITQGYVLSLISEAQWQDMARVLSSHLADGHVISKRGLSGKNERVATHKNKKPHVSRSRQASSIAKRQQRRNTDDNDGVADGEIAFDIALTQAAAAQLGTTSPTTAAHQALKPISVVLYGTTWCPACRAARQYFSQAGIRYRNYDVDKDQTAAAKMAAIQQSNGYPVGSIPLIIIGGRAYQGFSKLSMAGIVARIKASQS